MLNLKGFTVCSCHVTYGFQIESNRIQLQSLKPQDFAPASRKATIECGYTLKRVRDMTRTYRLEALQNAFILIYRCKIYLCIHFIYA